MIGTSASLCCHLIDKVAENQSQQMLASASGGLVLAHYGVGSFRLSRIQQSVFVGPSGSPKWYHYLSRRRLRASRRQVFRDGSLSPTRCSGAVLIYFYGDSDIATRKLVDDHG